MLMLDTFHLIFINETRPIYEPVEAHHFYEFYENEKNYESPEVVYKERI